MSFHLIFLFTFIILSYSAVAEGNSNYDELVNDIQSEIAISTPGGIRYLTRVDAERILVALWSYIDDFSKDLDSLTKMNGSISIAENKITQMSDYYFSSDAKVETISLKSKIALKHPANDYLKIVSNYSGRFDNIKIDSDPNIYIDIIKSKEKSNMLSLKCNFWTAFFSKQYKDVTLKSFNLVVSIIKNNVNIKTNYVKVLECISFKDALKKGLLQVYNK